jgi:hypothetical protein
LSSRPKFSWFASNIVNARAEVHGKQRQADQRRDDRPLVGGVQRARARLERAVGLAGLDGDRRAPHLDGPAVLEVGGRRPGDELQLVDREAPRGRDGVAPREVAVVADVDDRHAVERAAGDVDLARDGQVRLVEALGALPRLVRVAQEHALAVVGGLRAERDRVRADAEVVQAPVDRPGLEVPGRSLGAARGALGQRGRRRLRAADAVEPGHLRGQERQLVKRR